MGERRGRTAAGQDGVTVIEVLVAAAIALALLGAALSLLVQSIGGEGRTAQRTERLAELQRAADRMLRELREATAVRYAGDARGVVLTTRAGTEVAFDCTPGDGRRCVRREGGAQTAVLVRELAPGAPAAFTLSCRSATGQGYGDEGRLLEVTPGAVMPGHCRANPISHVALHLQARVPCDGQALTGCPDRSVRVDTSVGLHNAG